MVNSLYKATGDTKYLKSSAHIVNHVIGWWQQPSDHLVAGEVIGKNDWTKGTGWWYMYPRCDNCPGGYNGCNPWMAGSLISAIINFYEFDKEYHFTNHDFVREMLLQTMNYVVKYGWRDDWKFFIYSEAARDSDGGGTLLFFPLIYCYKR